MSVWGSWWRQSCFSVWSSRPMYCCSVQVLLCMAFGSRPHNSKWGNYLALIVEPFDYHRSDVAVWLSYLIFLVWHVGVIRLTGYLLYIGLYGWLHQPSEHPTPDFFIFDIVIVYCKLLQIDWRFGGRGGGGGTWSSLLSTRNHHQAVRWNLVILCKHNT